MTLTEYSFRRLVQTLFTALLLSLSLSVVAQSSRIITEAHVVDSKPIYRVVQINAPSQECWQEPVAVGSSRHFKAPVVFGAIADRGAQNQNGDARDYNAATVAGAVFSGAIVHDIEKRNPRSRARMIYEQRCRTVENFRTEEHFEGYDVTYEYNGHLYKTRTTQHPGQSIKIIVNVIPMVK